MCFPYLDKFKKEMDSDFKNKRVVVGTGRGILSPLCRRPHANQVPFTPADFFLNHYSFSFLTCPHEEHTCCIFMHYFHVVYISVKTL